MARPGRQALDDVEQSGSGMGSRSHCLLEGFFVYEVQAQQIVIIPCELKEGLSRLSDPLLEAVRWIEQLMFGRAATYIAIIAIAGIGAAMLAGKVDRNRALAALVGCFVVFGAATIGSGIAGDPTAAPELVRADPFPILPTTVEFQNQFDPYAGAAFVVPSISKGRYRDSERPH